MKFMNEHLDIFWHQTGGKLPDSHGIIGKRSSRERREEKSKLATLILL